ncbi:MAG TPA: carbohydrate ABC transporter permease [Gemmatimonadaceae bacterium]|nr:carbohydrate ABC transporter permease [Gemmatimonadaceae bacterium]HWG53907.1 carbohydrate ABC transporter permease [Gemmatimonadaceae bacterium]
MSGARPGRLRAHGARVLVYLLLVAGAVLALLPLVWMVSASLMPTGAANSYPPRLLPSHPTLVHYREIFTRLAMGRFVLNSAIIAGTVTAVSLLVNSMAGYAFAKLRFRGRDRLFRWLTLGLVVPVQVAMLPLFLMFKEMGLINTYWGVIIPSLASIFGIFLIRQYAIDIPEDLLDAARIDGAGEFRIYWSVVVPVIVPILATLAIWTFLTTWNDFMWPLIVLSDQSKFTLPVALASLSGEHILDTELMMAGSVVTVLPVLIVFLALQRYYVQGIMAGSVKG